MTSEDITIRVPRHYAPQTGDSFAPPLEWLHRTWTVTHSTLKRWRTAQNLTIAYGPHPASGSSPRVTDTVTYQSKGQLKAKVISGIDAAAAGDTTVWVWRGSGLLKPITCRWELIGWGERTVDGKVERWAVTWFAKTLFTEEGVDVYCDRREGMSEETAGEIRKALEGVGREELAKLVKERLETVAIDLSMKPDP